MEKVNFFDLNVADLKAHLARSGSEKYRALQLYQWVYQKRVENVSSMSNLAKKFREELPKWLEFKRPEIKHHALSQDGTRKYLFDVGNGQTVEAVLIPNKHRLTLCVSSEVGCNMACRFCFTAKQKLKKRLSPSEIVGQYLGVLDHIGSDRKITNIVFMGMGEPLDNSENVFKAVDILNFEGGLAFSRKRITVSTSGLINEIPKVADARVRLAVSLNATTDEIRSQVMPINKKYPLKDLLASCRSYALATGDNVTFEYVLLKGVTDSIEDAKRLAKIAKSMPSKINLIPFNEHPNSGYVRPTDESVDNFQNELIKRGVRVYRRKTMGRDIYAACGQLRTLFEGKFKQEINEEFKANLGDGALNRNSIPNERVTNV